MARNIAKLDENVLGVGSSLTKFTYDLYNTLKTYEGEDKNIFVSPYSIFVALSMVYAGARQNTASQMEKTLQIDGSTKTVVHDAHRKYISLLEEIKNFDLHTANRMYININFELLTKYFEEIKKMYHSLSENLDFGQAPKDAAKKINNWVQDITKDKIKDIIPDGYLNSDTALVLVNAIYFKGNWGNKFNPSLTKSEDFFKSSTEKVPVDMMFIKKSFRLRQDSKHDCQILELPYEGSCLSMYIILPNQIDGIEALHKSISSDFLQSIIENQQFHSGEVEVKLPKFKMESSFELKQHLVSLGMADLFDQQKADLSGISNCPLYVSEVFHKAFVEVNEEGTEAAAATAAIVMTRCAMVRMPPLKFIANHPFVFLIVDKRSQMILFMGKLNKP
ncbi:leukocyte elastase inhibitor-like [Octopus sinensis]|uniref:Leukocyte elastase inhibitor-like n=1 Tax=Octopus sinensis TaxID=2607531 RepID=A0A6P7TDD3_9MOLL|nr:leukocyte elastase inhibitor-like [Octopus sinensis]